MEEPRLPELEDDGVTLALADQQLALEDETSEAGGVESLLLVLLEPPSCVA